MKSRAKSKGLHGGDARFEILVQRAIRAQTRSPHSFWRSLRVLAMAEDSIAHSRRKH